MVSVSGIRGTIGATLTPRVACDFGCAFGTMLGEPRPVEDSPWREGSGLSCRTVVVGRDTRPSGAMIQSAVTAGLLATGVSVVDLGVVSTPGVGLMAIKTQADGAVMITASHNPPQYNGIKFLQPNGCCLPADAANRLKEIWQGGSFALRGAMEAGQASRNGKTHGLHVDAVCGICDTTLISSKRFKVVLDSINGSGCVVTPMLLGRLGCEFAHLNAEPTGKFAHEPEPIAQNLTGLGQAVLKHKAAVGFAQDPDADRLVVVDERGRFIGEEYTLALATAFVLRHRKGKIATNLATSRMIDDIAAAAGVEVVRAATGEANVVEAMFKSGAIFGGEGNGGVIDPRVVPVRNSLVGIAYILQYLAETGLTLSQLVAQIRPYVMLKTKFPCPAGVAPAVAAKTRAVFAARQGAKFDDRDGLRIDLPDGWVSVRASNTEPIMRIMAEATDAKTADNLVAQVRKIADEVIG
jgi:phosphomannomutase